MCALSYALLYRLIHKLPTSYHDGENLGYVFAEDGCRVLQPSDAIYNNTTTWHLVDSNENLTSIPESLRRAYGKIVQATSPKRERHVEWTKQKAAITWWMSPPTWQELYVTMFVVGDLFQCVA